jgi:hypothetical protein
LDARSEGRVTTDIALRGRWAAKVLINLAPGHRCVASLLSDIRLAVMLLEELAHAQIGQCSGVMRERDVPEPSGVAVRPGWRPTAVARRLAGSSSAML